MCCRLQVWTHGLSKAARAQTMPRRTPGARHGTAGRGICTAVFQCGCSIQLLELLMASQTSGKFSRISPSTFRGTRCIQTGKKQLSNMALGPQAAQPRLWEDEKTLTGSPTPTKENYGRSILGTEPTTGRAIPYSVRQLHPSWGNTPNLSYPEPTCFPLHLLTWIGAGESLPGRL